MNIEKGIRKRKRHVLIAKEGVGFSFIYYDTLLSSCTELLPRGDWQSEICLLTKKKSKKKCYSLFPWTILNRLE